MSFDLTKIVTQIDAMAGKIKADNLEGQRHLQNAMNKISDPGLNIEKLKRKIEAGRKTITYLVAGITEDFNNRYPLPEVPTDFAVLATDGSQIPLDRNRAAHCFVINIGEVMLRYGSQPDAQLDNTPRLYVNEDELEIVDEKNERNKRTIDSTLLGIKRSVEELRRLSEVAAALPQDLPALALVDGTLVLWGFEGYPDFVIEKLLSNDYLKSMDAMQTLAEKRKVALASYISLPRGTDVVNAVRVAVCPQELPNCDKCPLIEGKRACDAVGGVQDQMLFSNILQPGERSALFFSQSQVIDQYYGNHRIYFYYLKVEDEIARVEIPEWIVRRPDLLDLTHVLVYEQCRIGQGYPVALSEAHEQAVVTDADREEFWELVERTLIEEKMSVYNSTKSRSKRTRWV